LPGQRWLLCRPKDGLNDTLCQIARACRYGERFGRTVVIDTGYPGTPTFGDRFSRYFESRDPRLLLEPAPLWPIADSLDAYPTVIEGRITRYGYRIDPFSTRFVESDSGEVLTFDYARDYPHTLLVDHSFYGGDDGPDALARLRLAPELFVVLRERLAQLGPRFCAVHIRDTDLQTHYRDSSGLDRISPRLPIFVATDNAVVVDFFRERFGEGRVHSFALFPDPPGGTLHGIINRSHIFERNRDAILDLIMLGLAAELHVFHLAPNAIGKTYSGFSRLAAALNGNRAVLAGLLSRD